MPLDPRRLVKQSLLDRWADELLAVEREVIDGRGVDVEQLHTISRELRLVAGGFPVGLNGEA